MLIQYVFYRLNNKNNRYNVFFYNFISQTYLVMMKFYNSQFFRLPMLILFFSIGSQAQIGIVKIPLDKQVELSNQIVEGEVISKASFWNDAHTIIYTRQKIQVYKVFKGQPLNTIEVITLGGIVDFDAQVVSHSLQLRNGDIGLFVLKQNTSNNLKNTFVAVSDLQSFYKYDLEKNLAVNPFNTILDIDTKLYTQLEQDTGSEFIEIAPLSDSSQFQTKSTSTYSKSTLSPTISSFSTTGNSAGTRSVLTINGSGFGTSKGTVGFSDADYGGSIYTNALDNQVLSWTDSQIQVEIPEIAGTGTFKVNTVSNGSIISSTNLTVDFAQINMTYDLGSGPVDYPTQHVDLDGEGGITFTINQDFYNSAAMQPFQRAMDAWSCESGINWKIGSTTTSSTRDPYDGINLVKFSSMALGTLGYTFSSYSACYQDGEIKWFVRDVDMLFNSNQNWNFTENSPQSSQLDFESVAVHELGHAYQLGHVINASEVMHYSLSSGMMERSLSDKDLLGSSDVQFRSTNEVICSQQLMTNSPCFSGPSGSLGTDDALLAEHMSIYPNPANETLYVKNTGYLNIDNIAIYDVLGKQVYLNLVKNSFTLKTIDVSRFTKGMYFIKIDSEFGSLTKKLIIN